ncbi:MAG: GNAT family protein [Pseudomonadota bacterium]
MTLHTATAADIPWIMALEQRPENAPFVYVSDAAAHDAHRAGPNSVTLVFEEAGARLGYAMLRGLASKARSVELMRIIVDQPGQGVGGRFLRALIAHVFGELGANRLWLDVFEDNARGRAAYRREGFVEEGILREAALTTDGRLGSLVVMSILSRERAAPEPGAGPGTG